MNYLIKTHQLTKTFNHKEVISQVNLNVKQGEIYGFLGPNGAGKTTLIKLLTNLIKPTVGEIELFGERLTTKSYHVLRRIGSIIEYPIFYERLTARENLLLHCEYMGYYDDNAIDQALEMVNLRNIDGKSVKDFSLGMKQRLGIARAISTKPELLILDEPINGLDPIGIKEMRDLFKMLCKEYGITILISSHILAEIEQIADTIGVIKEGKILQEFSLETLRKDQAEYIEVTVDDVKKASYVFEHHLRLTNFKVMGNESIRVYDQRVSEKDITKALVFHDVAIEGINKKINTLEEYFIKLIDGGRIHA